MSGWFDSFELDLSSIQDQINKSVLEATKVFEEVSKAEILNLDALAEQEEEDEKYEEIIKGMDYDDIESLVARNHLHQDISSNSTLLQNSTPLKESFSATEIYQKSPAVIGFDDNPDEPVVEEDSWMDFEYPSHQSIPKPSSSSRSTLSPIDEQMHQTITGSSIVELDCHSDAQDDSVVVEPVSADNAILIDETVAGDTIESVNSVHDSLTMVVKGDSAEKAAVESAADTSDSAAPVMGIASPAEKIVNPKPNTKSKRASEINNKSQSKVAVMSISNKTKDSRDSRNMTFTPRDLSISLNESRSPVGDVDLPAPSVPIPAHVLERLLKKREKKMKKKGIWTNRETAAIASTDSASQPLDGSISISVLGFGYDEVVSSSAPAIESVAVNGSSSGGILSSLFGASATVSTEQIDDHANEDANEQEQEAYGGSVVSGFAFPISFSQLASNATKAATLQFRSVFDDIEDGATEDPILRQVEENKLHGANRAKNILSSHGRNGSQDRGFHQPLSPVEPSTIEVPVPNVQNSWSQALFKFVRSTTSAASVSRADANVHQSISTSSVSSQVPASSLNWLWAALTGPGNPSTDTGVVMYIHLTKNVLQIVFQILYWIFSYLWLLLKCVLESILGGFSSGFNYYSGSNIALCSLETWSNSDQRTRALQSIADIMTSTSGLSILTGILLLYSYFKFQRFGTDSGN